MYQNSDPFTRGKALLKLGLLIIFLSTLLITLNSGGVVLVSASTHARGCEW